MSRNLLLAMLVASGMMTGCGDGSGHRSPEVTEANVTVTLGGKPLPNAQVTFTPADTAYGPSATSTGITDASGVVKLTCGGKPGACVGLNRVTIAEAPVADELRGDDPQLQAKASKAIASQPNRPIPPKYGNLVQGKLELEIKKGQAEYKLELQR
ncbi:hypothetical protein [Zavarzinella formosa]|uniref:hypothetical protein n=1 Tax=Zavarzinella formosa TaxID=360055 RepID=UPI0002F1AB96|nr:hypothetical protein [Zavarzinella formosa]